LYNSTTVWVRITIKYTTVRHYLERIINANMQNSNLTKKQEDNRQNMNV